VLLATLARLEPLEHLGRLAMLEATAWMALPVLLAHRGEMEQTEMTGPLGPLALLAHRGETGPPGPMAHQPPSARNP
jgi:hypothetical protein